MLQIKDLTVYHGAIKALDQVSFAAPTGEITAVIGSNGAGKTTLLRTLSGLLKPSSGSATWNGNEILKRKTENLVRDGIVHISDGMSVIKELTVSENLTLGGLWRKDKSGLAKSKSEVLEIFPQLAQRLNQRADTLSGGERQMLAIGRALVSTPKLLLLDEPSLGLAPLIINQIFDVISKLRSQFGMTVILVEQNANSALSIANQAVIINLGKIISTGSAEEIRKNTDLAKEYLGY